MLYLHCTFQHLLFSRFVETKGKDRLTHKQNDYTVVLRPPRHNYTCIATTIDAHSYTVPSEVTVICVFLIFELFLMMTVIIT